MKLPGPLVPATLLRREKRFLAYIELPDGGEAVAHCANPGAMRSCLPLGGRCWVSPRPPEAGGLRWALQAVLADGVPVLVNTALPNPLVAEALATGGLPELGPGPWRREVPLPNGGRADFAAEGPRWLEVKGVSWRLSEGTGAFPDAVSARATRHLTHLAARVRAGQPAAVLLLATRPDIRRIEPADALDPAFGAALRGAAAAGVRVLGRGLLLDLERGEARVGEALPVEL